MRAWTDERHEAAKAALPTLITLGQVTQADVCDMLLEIDRLRAELAKKESRE